MDMTKVSLKIRHRTNADLFYDTTGEITPLSTSQRFKIAIKSLIICWVAGALFILIPVLHFILVPVALVAGIILFFRSFKLTNYLHSPTEIACPSCKKTVALKPGPFNWPLIAECLACRSEININENH